MMPSTWIIGFSHGRRADATERSRRRGLPALEPQAKTGPPCRPDSDSLSREVTCDNSGAVHRALVLALGQIGAFDPERSQNALQRLAS